MADDGTIEIKISASLDPSLNASVAQAVDGLNKLKEQGKLSADQIKALFDAPASQRAGLIDGLTGGGSAAEQMNTSFNKATEGAKNLSNANSGVTREIIVLGDEVLRGNFSRIPGSLLVLTNRMNLLQDVSAGTLLKFGALGAGAFALGAAFDYVIEKANEVHAAMQSALAGGALANNLVSEKGITAATDALDKIPDVATEVAQKTVGVFAGMRGMTDSVLQSLTDHIYALSVATHKDMPEAAQTLREFMESPAQDGPKFLDMIGASAEQIKKFRQAASEGNAQALSSGLQIFAQRMDAIDKSTINTPAALKRTYDQVANLQSVSQTAAGGLDDIGGAMANATNRAKEFTQASAAKSAKDLASAMQDAARATALLPPDMQAVHTHLTEIEAQTNLTRSQILQKQIEYLNQQKTAAATSAEDEVALDQTIAAKRVELARTTSAEIVATAREQASQQAAAAGGDTGAGLRAQVAADKQILADSRVTADEKVNIGRDMNEKLAELGRQAASKERQDQLQQAMDSISDARNATTEILSNDRITDAQKLTQTRAVWSQLLAGDKLNAKEREQAKRDEAAAVTQLTKQAASDKEQIENDELRTSLQLAQIDIDGKKAQLDIDVANFRITNDEKFAALKQYEAQEAAEEIKALARQQAQYAQGTVQWKKYQDQIVLIKAQANAKILARDRQANQQDSQVWRQGVTQIESSFNNALNGMLTGTMTWQQGVQGLVQGVAQAFLQVAENIAETWLETQLENLLVTKTTSSTSTVGQILDAAAVAAANAYASTAAIPYVGPMLAPAAAATAFGEVSALTSVAAFDVGTPMVPRDMTAQIHAGEIIVPETFSDAIRSGKLTLGGGNSDSGGGGGDTHVHVHIHSDGAPVDGAWFNKNSGFIMRVVKNNVRNLR